MKDLTIRTPMLEALQEAICCENLLEWIETEAAKLAKLGMRGGCVLFTDEVLRERSIRSIIKQKVNPLESDATIEFGTAGSGYVIRYKATTSERIRFSVAHEIGHTYFADEEGRPLTRIGNRSDPTIESICDYFARALLLPRERVLKRLAELAGASSYPPLHLVRTLANEFRVSEQCVVRRMVFDLFDGFVAAVCITSGGVHKGWRTSWCAPLGKHDLPKFSGWRVPLDSNGRRIPCNMVPAFERGRTIVTSVDGRWADLSRPKALTQSRVPFSTLPIMPSVRAVVASFAGDRGLFDEPLEKGFVALGEITRPSKREIASSPHRPDG